MFLASDSYALAPLTDKERAFVLAYVECLNGAKAARAAHYSERTIYTIGVVIGGGGLAIDADQVINSRRVNISCPHEYMCCRYRCVCIANVSCRPTERVDRSASIDKDMPN